MELAIYMDDSSDARQEEIVVAGAAFGLPEKWFDVERYWNRELSRYGLSSFHATECESLRGQFQKFRVEGDRPAAQRKADAIRLDLIGIANAGGIVYAAVGIRRDDWKLAIAKDKYKDLKMPDDPVFFAYHLLMVQCMTRIAKHHKFSVAAFVCDSHNRHQLAQKAYYRLKELNPESAKHMGSIDHRSASRNAPLQVADLVAHESRHFMLGNNERPSGYRAAEGNVLWCFGDDRVDRKHAGCARRSNPTCSKCSYSLIDQRAFPRYRERLSPGLT